MNLLVSVLTLVGWALWVYTILFVDPDVALAPLAFYAALFVALTGTLARLLGGSSLSQSGEPVPSSVPSLGHAALVSTLVLFALWLQSLRMLTSLNGTLLVITFVLIELGFFLSGGGRRPRTRRQPARAATSDAGLAGER